MRLRDTRCGIALRRAHQAGRPVVLAFEVAAVVAVVAMAVWTSTSPGSGLLAITHLVAVAAATALVVLASMITPDNAPPAPSWWTKQRRGMP